MTKRHFLLDENVIILAQTQRDERQQQSSTCLELILAIEANCHSLVLPYSAWRRYVSQVRSLRAPQGSNVIRMLDASLRNANKHPVFLTDDALPVVEDIGDWVKEPDQLFVRATVAVPRCVLATTDARLVDSLGRARVPQLNDVVALHPGEALEIARTET